jgi:hypothetical protein
MFHDDEYPGVRPRLARLDYLSIASLGLILGILIGRGCAPKYTPMGEKSFLNNRTGTVYERLPNQWIKSEVVREHRE